MPMYETYLAELNHRFGKDEIKKFATERREHFAPGKPLDLGFLLEQGTALHQAWQAYTAQAPGSFQEAVRAVIFHALSTDPPTPVTFAWAPGYEFEFSLWQASDTQTTRGGITVLLKSRYPGDPHPPL